MDHGVCVPLVLSAFIFLCKTSRMLQWQLHRINIPFMLFLVAFASRTIHCRYRNTLSIFFCFIPTRIEVFLFFKFHYIFSLVLHFDTVLTLNAAFKILWNNIGKVIFNSIISCWLACSPIYFRISVLISFFLSRCLYVFKKMN